MAFNGPINEAFPTPDAADRFTVSHIQKGFKISARKLPISKSGPIDEMSHKLGIPVPEMIFGDNMVSIEYVASGWRLEFNAFDALDRVDKTDKNMLKVAYSQEWSSSREKTHEGIKEVVKPFDWSYSTDYKGTITRGEDFKLQTGKAEPIPLELLKRPDPILFFEEVVLYESELDDNGISVLSCKVRVMPDRMLVLSRLFMRLDGVLFRVRDTRIYVDFNTRKVIRDYAEREDEFEKVKKACSTFHLVHKTLWFKQNCRDPFCGFPLAPYTKTPDIYVSAWSKAIDFRQGELGSSMNQRPLLAPILLLLQRLDLISVHR